MGTIAEEKQLTEKDVEEQQKKIEADKANGADTTSVVMPEFNSTANVDAVNELYSGKRESEEERRKREKREKWTRIASAIGDGISSIANLYYTTKGAPNAYNPQRSLSKRAQERFERLKAEREAVDRAYVSDLQRAQALDAAANKASREAWMKERDAKQRQANADRTYQFSVDKAERDEAFRQAQLEENKRKNKVAEENAQRRTNAYVANTNRGSNRARRKLVLGNETHEYDTSEEYQKAVMAAAKKYGIPFEEEYVINPAEMTPSGKVLKEARKGKRARNIAVVAAEVEEAAREEKSKKKPNPMGGSNKKKNPMN